MSNRSLSNKNLSQQIEWSLGQLLKTPSSDRLKTRFRSLVMEEKRRFCIELGTW